MSTLFICLYFLMCAVALMQVHCEDVSSEECLRLGFNSLSLKCETCSTLVRIIGEDEELQKDCLRCCSNSIEETYELAVLEVDKRFISSFPNIPDIVKAIPSSKSKKKSDKDNSNSNVAEAAKKLQNRAISVNYRFGARPTLYLFKKKDDEVADKTTFVGTWNMDDFIDYVTSHVSIVAKK